MANPTYKTLELKLRIAGLTIAQWAQLVGSALVAIGFGTRLSPLPAGPTFTVSVLIAGFPVAVSYGLSGSEFSAVQLARGIWRWRVRPRRFTSGPGVDTAGYAVATPDHDPELEASTGMDDQLDMEDAWDV